MKITALGLLIGLILSGCTSLPPRWKDVGGHYTETTQNFEIDLPQGWKQPGTAHEGVFITRDGMLLQSIGIYRVPVDKDLAHTKKKFTKGMLPQEAAEVNKDDLISNPDLSNLRFIEESPATIGGFPGFKLVYEFQPRGGPDTKIIKYGLVQGDWYYNLFYTAPARYYFDKDAATFEKGEEFVQNRQIGFSLKYRIAMSLPGAIRFGRDICGDLAQAERREWWLANLRRSLRAMERGYRFTTLRASLCISKSPTGLFSGTTPG